MNNHTLKTQLLTLCENIDTGLINPDECQAYDLDLIVTSDITASQLIDWFVAVAGSPKRRDNAVFIMSEETYKIVSRLHDDNGVFLWTPSLAMPSAILGKPYIIKAKI